VDEPGGVGGIEGARGLPEEVDCAFRVEAARLELARERMAAFDQAHRQEEAELRLPDLVCIEHVGMLDGCLQAPLVAQPRPERIVLGERCPQHLESDPPVERKLGCLVDDAHSPEPEHALDSVAVQDGSGLDQERLPTGEV
jgi:hypothetical protein